jgi:hypothetical protein
MYTYIPGLTCGYPTRANRLIASTATMPAPPRERRAFNTARPRRAAEAPTQPPRSTYAHTLTTRIGAFCDGERATTTDGPKRERGCVGMGMCVCLRAHAHARRHAALSRENLRRRAYTRMRVEPRVFRAQPSRAYEYPELPQSTQSSPEYPRAPQSTHSTSEYPRVPQSSPEYPEYPEYPKLPRAPQSSPEYPMSSPPYPLGVP